MASSSDLRLLFLLPIVQHLPIREICTLILYNKILDCEQLFSYDEERVAKTRLVLGVSANKLDIVCKYMLA